MLPAYEVAKSLGYVNSSNWVTPENLDLETAHLHRQAQKVGVAGTYVFRTSPDQYSLLPKRSAVHVVAASTREEAREIHRKLWNLSDAPFLIVVLPGEVRVYTGFAYDRSKDQALKVLRGVLTSEQLRDGLAEFRASEIDSGRIWQTWGKKISLDKRVDQHLLNNLRTLGRILINDRKIAPEIAHSLIGKYIYIKYLKDRGILSDLWLQENNINLDKVLGREANVSSLRALVDALEERFNGRVFPLPLQGEKAPKDEDIAYVASVFLGDSTYGQLSLDFKIYDFSFIPIELLSSIYEQFLHVQGEGQKAGAYYTPEPLADYLLSEINAAHPLQSGFKIIDPCCGSGVFLVLAYRRLIEMHLRSKPDGKLRPTEVRQILVDSIFGVERNLEACYVAEFSLLLTMLSYIDPPDLHRNRLKFPDLHNKQIFHHDFFDEAGKIWSSGLTFDWVVGNPPWLELKGNREEDRPARSWMKRHARRKPAARGRICEAFTWRVTDLLSENGFVGLIIHAKSLTNEQSDKYRKEFFSAHDVLKVTNFSNLAYVLFGKRAEAPAATIIYRRHKTDQQCDTIHYGPFIVNQVPVRSQRNKQSWTITVYENEITVLHRSTLISGDGAVWKMALWGNPRDEKALSRLRRLFPKTLKEFADERGWYYGLGVQLRGARDKRKGKLKHIPELEGTKAFNSKRMNASKARFTVPPTAVMDSTECFVREQGGTAGVRLIKAPHMVISAAYAAYSDTDFSLPHPRVGLAAPPGDDELLRALSVYLNSGVARYIAFFVSTQWGVDRTTVGYRDIAEIRVPDFTEEQIRSLSELYEICASEDKAIERVVSSLDALTPRVIDILELPRVIAEVIEDFVTIRLETNKGKTRSVATRPPSDEQLLSYGVTLKTQLDGFARISHQISLRVSADFVVCEIDTEPPSVLEGAVAVLSGHPEQGRGLWDALRQTESQWVYVQKSLRIFDGSRLYLYKPRRLLDWTRTQAMLDADDIIAEVLSGGIGGQG